MFSKNKKSTQQCADNIFCGVNTAEYIEQASELEKKHLPIVSAPSSVKKGEFFEIKVEVGKLLRHPNEPGHFIQFIELYSDDTYLSRIDFTARTTRPMIKTCIALEKDFNKLRAFERCNLHGVWENEVEKRLPANQSGKKGEPSYAEVYISC